MKNFKYIFLLLSISVFAACSEDRELYFNQPASIFVDELTDSLEYTFATSPEEVLTDTVEINFRIVGKASDSDRIISLQPAPGASAKSGYHYLIGESVIKAGEFSAVVPIYVFRRPGLKDSTVTVLLELKANDAFQLGYTDMLSFKLSVTDILKKPTNWDTVWMAYFGPYSEVKFKFLLDVTGKTDWNSYPFPQDSRFLSQKAKNALLEYNQENGPLIDEFGNDVIFT